MSAAKKGQADPEALPPQAERWTRIFSDEPICGEDRPVSFEFEGFARTLADLALNPENETPFTVVVKGEWGRGKTTLLRRTQAILDREGKREEAKVTGARPVRTLWFNAWKCAQED